MKDPSAVRLGRLGGKKGGSARARKMSPERMSEIGRMGAAARWNKQMKSQPRETALQYEPWVGDFKDLVIKILKNPEDYATSLIEISRDKKELQNELFALQREKAQALLVLAGLIAAQDAITVGLGDGDDAATDAAWLKMASLLDDGRRLLEDHG